MVTANRMERKRQTEEESREVTGLDSWLGMGDEEEELPHPDCEASSLSDWQLVKVLTEWKSKEGKTALRVELGFRFLVEFGLLLTPLSFERLYPSPSWTHFMVLGKPTPSSVSWCIYQVLKCCGLYMEFPQWALLGYGARFHEAWVWF